MHLMQCSLCSTKCKWFSWVCIILPILLIFELRLIYQNPTANYSAVGEHGWKTAGFLRVVFFLFVFGDVGKSNKRTHNPSLLLSPSEKGSQDRKPQRHGQKMGWMSYGLWSHQMGIFINNFKINLYPIIPLMSWIDFSHPPIYGFIQPDFWLYSRLL